VETKAQVDTLAETLQEAKAKTALDTLGDTKTKALKEMLANTLAEAKSKTLDDILGDVKAHAQIDTLAGKKMWKSRHCSGCWLTPWQMQAANKLGGRLGDLEAKAVLDRLTNALAEVKAGTLGDTLGDVEAHALVDTLTDTLP